MQDLSHAITSLMANPTISVVIVGRDSAGDLNRYVEDPERLDFSDEVIYVDSNSQDNSVELAKSLSWRVFVLKNSSVLSAAAGRYVGTLESRFDYILFLDSDMECQFDVSLKEMIADRLVRNQESGVVGLVGPRIDVYRDGTTRWRKIRHDKKGKALGFGGMVLFQRSALLQTGNWNANVIANEEMELYARLQRGHYSVLYEPRMIVKHLSPDANPIVRARSAVLPLSARERSFFGSYGLATQGAIRSGCLLNLMRAFPEPWLTIIIFAAVAVAKFLGYTYLGVLTGVALAIPIVRRRSFCYLLVCPMRVVHLLYGLAIYRVRAVAYSIG